MYYLRELNLVRFVMCTLVSRDCVPFCKYIKRHVYPRTQDTHDKLNKIRFLLRLFELQYLMRALKEPCPAKLLLKGENRPQFGTFLLLPFSSKSPP